MMKNWKLVKTKSCFQSIPFDVVEIQFKKPNNGGKMNAYVIQSPNWVNVIGLNKRKEVLLIRQFRFGTKKIELEIPGGIIEDGEKPLKAAKREFEEETGYKSEDWKQIGMVDANPAIMNNKCYTFLAKNISATGK